MLVQTCQLAITKILGPQIAALAPDAGRVGGEETLLLPSGKLGGKASGGLNCRIQDPL